MAKSAKTGTDTNKAQEKAQAANPSAETAQAKPHRKRRPLIRILKGDPPDRTQPRSRMAGGKAGLIVRKPEDVAAEPEAKKPVKQDKKKPRKPSMTCVATTDFQPKSKAIHVSKVGGVKTNVAQWVGGSQGGLFKIYPDGSYKFSCEDASGTTFVSFDADAGEGTARFRLSVDVPAGRDSQVLSGHILSVGPLKTQAPKVETPSLKKDAAPVQKDGAHDVLDLSRSTPPGGSFDIVYSGKAEDAAGYEGTITYFDHSGGVVSSLDFVARETVVPCFAPGMMVKTKRGDIAIETLVAGDLVKTRHNGFQPVRWVGSKHVTRRQLAKKPQLNPVRIQPHSFGENKPDRALLVSSQQRLLLKRADLRAQLGMEEHMATAQAMLALEGVEQAEPKGITYIHIMFDEQQTILADGLWFESFHPSATSLAALDQEKRAEIFELFPDLMALDGVTTYDPSVAGTGAVDYDQAFAAE